MSKRLFCKADLAIERIRTTINSHEVEAGVAPRCGANLVSLRVDGHEYLHYDEAALLAPDERYTGCFIMFPTPCRLPEAKYEFQGGTIEQSKRGCLYDMHGLVRDEAFEFARIEGGLVLSLEITPEHPVYEGYPFAGRLAVTLKLIERGLEYSFSFENRGPAPAPFGFGLHPFWAIPGRREDVYVTLPCDEVMVLDGEVPTGEVRDVNDAGVDLREPTSLGALDLDAVFLAHPGNEPPTIEYRGNGKRLILEASEVFTHRIVFCPPGEPFVCLENLTCAPNAANLQSAPREISGFRTVDSGAILTGTTRFIVEDL